MKRYHIVPWSLVALALTAGCGAKPTMVGTWTGQEALPGGAGTVPSTLDLRPDGSFHKKGATQAEYAGTYAVKDGTLTETFKSYSVAGHVMSIPADTPNVETDTFTLQGDTLTLTPQGGGSATPTVLKRQKQ